MLTDKASSLKVAIEKGSRFANDNSLIIREIFKVLFYNDEPKLYSYGVCYKEKYNSGENEDAIASASGISFHRRKALITGNEILLPAQLLYIPYLYQNPEPLIRFPISTGAAAGETLNDASYRGICEIIERDAFMIAYLNKTPSPKIDLQSISDKTIRRIRNILKRYKLELIIIDLTNDLEVPVFASILLDKTGLGPAVSVGLKAGFDIKETMVGAIEESLMMRSWIRDKFIYTDPKYKRGKNIITIEDRAHFWFPVSSIKYLDFWLKNENFKKINVKNLRSSNNNLEKATLLLRERGIDAIYVDIIDKEIKKYNFKVVKVIIPKLCPLYLDEGHPYLGVERLYNVPVKMRFFRNKKTENQLNKIPH